VTRPAFALAALLVAGCAAQHTETVPYNLTPTDQTFILAVHSNTRLFFGLDDPNIALFGQGVCEVLRRGGVLTQAAVRLPGAPTDARGKLAVRTVAGQDALYFAKLAAQDYCPTLPTTKPRPKA
jgi:hypothetical protein